MPNLTFGNYSVDLAQVPESVIVQWCNNRLAHKLSNEVARSVVGKVREALNNDDADADAINAYRKANQTQVDAWTHELREAVIARILAGDVGKRGPTGPRKDPVDVRVKELVVKHIKASLAELGKAAGTKYTYPSDDTTVITFADGTTRTRPEMIANTMAAQGDKLRSLAEKQLREEARLAERAKNEAAKPEATVASMGI